ncbi:MAG TPA: Vms1/Ankzf1 family peptidyl-tRNA hydrolase, partial [Acidimicrobiales bacterium]|nr:Vms1/Ankzf1 family peptidyl-tRNA hydrolase [Acidimicrobiales bacterium]
MGTGRGMERSGTIPRGGVSVDDLRGLFETSDGVASVYLETPGAIDNASRRDLLRWHDARARLDAEGAPPAALDAIGALVPEAHHDGAALAAFADAGGLRLSAHGARPPRAPLARWDTLPSVVPLVLWRQEWPPHLVVVVDRTGADIFAGGRLLAVTGETGRDRPVHDSAKGGWSQRHHQERVHGVWARNASLVVEQVNALAASMEPEVILIGGDERAESMVRSALPPDLAARVEEVALSRAADGSDETGPAAVTTMVATAAARDTVAVLEELRQQLGRQGRAVQGAAATFDALRQGQVGLLLVH